MSLPEYAWAQGLLVAVHSLVLAYENVINCPSMTLEKAAEKLDSLRRVHKLHSAPQQHCIICLTVVHCIQWTSRDPQLFLGGDIL